MIVVRIQTQDSRVRLHNYWNIRKLIKSNPCACLVWHNNNKFSCKNGFLIFNPEV